MNWKFVKRIVIPIVLVLTIFAITLGLKTRLRADDDHTLSGRSVTLSTDPYKIPSIVSKGLSVLAQSLDDKGLTLVWSKPDNYEEFSDYDIYENGAKIGDANSNNSPAMKFFNLFYADRENSDAVKTTTHNYVVTGLAPDKKYTFTVKAVQADGKLIDLGSSYTLSITTNATPTVVDVTTSAYGAKGDGATLDTAAIQKAIDNCPADGKVLLPAGKTFLSGALYLKSNVTFEIDGTLMASSNVQDMLGSVTLGAGAKSDKRFPALININGKSGAYLQNIRIVGTGTVNGNGWRYQKPDPKDFEYNADDRLTESMICNQTTIESNGVLAKNEYDYAMTFYKNANTKAKKKDSESGAEAYAYETRSAAIEGNYVNHLYIGGGLTVTNPAHMTTAISYVNNYVVNGIYAQSYNTNNGDTIHVSKFNGFTVLNCVANSGDDDIVMNSGGKNDGNAWIFDNYIARGHGGVVFGSGINPGISNILAEDNIMVGTKTGLRCKAKPDAGGYVADVAFRDTAMKDLTGMYNGNQGDDTNYPFCFTGNYDNEKGKSSWPVFHDFYIADVSVNGCRGKAIFNDGTHGNDISNFRSNYNLNFDNISFKNCAAASLDCLKNSMFQNVSSDSSDFWKTADCSGLTFCTLKTKNGSLICMGSAVSGSLADMTTATNVNRVSYTIVRQPEHGMVKLMSNGSYTYVPAKGYTGNDSFSFKALNSVTAAQISLPSNISTISLVVNNHSSLR